MSRRTLPLVLTVAVVIALIGAAVTFAVGVTRDSGPVPVAYTQAGMMGPGMASGFGMMGGGMMGGMMGSVWTGAQAEAAPVDSVDEAKASVEEWLANAGFEGFDVAEVMAFLNGFYAAVDDPRGAGAFELLVDPATGWVSPEPGPNMMWNTEYGMMGGRLGALMMGGGSTGTMMGGGMMGVEPGTGLDAPGSPAEAQALADRWLDKMLPGETAEAPRVFPGYYTLDTERNGRAQGMLSVNAQTGAVWYHAWHGSFLDELEP